MVKFSIIPESSHHQPSVWPCLRPSVISLWSVFLVFATGCGDGLTRISGTVLVDGKPAMEGVRVVFTPLGNTKQANGVVETEGRFKLKTGQRPGVMPGAYQVLLINSTESIPQPDTPIEPGVNVPPPEWIAYDRKLTAFLQRPPQGEGWIPVVYGSLAESPLRYRVPEDGTEAQFDISNDDQAPRQ